MTTAYTSLLGLALPVTGELSGTWGDTVNNSITSLVDTAVAGTTNVSADSNVTLTTTTGASNQARQAILLFSGARTAIRTVTAPAQSKIYTVINATTGGFAVQLVGAGPTTGVTIANGAKTVVAWNGSDFVEVSSPSSIILPGGTANGVLYLNGSKVVTSGSALSFDGTKLEVNVPGTTGTTSAFRLSRGVGYGTTDFKQYYTSSTNYGLTIGNTLNDYLTLNLANGNLGLGVTPDPWYTLGTAFESYGYAFEGRSGTPDYSAYWTNAYLNATGSAFVYRGNGFASAYLQGQGSHRWRTAPSGTAGNGITFTEVMTLDASGNLGIGTTSPSYRLDVSGFNATARINSSVAGGNSELRFLNGTGNNAAILFGDTDAADVGFIQYVHSDNSLRINVNAAERARIASDGNFLLGGTSSVPLAGIFGQVINGSSSAGTAYNTSGRDWLLFTSTSGAYSNGLIFYDNTAGFERARFDTSGNLLIGTTGGPGTPGLTCNVSAAGWYVADFINTSSNTSYGLRIRLPGGGSSQYLVIGQSDTTNVFYIAANGNVQNTNNSYGAISDAKLKENIVDATPKLANLMQVRVRNYNLKGEYEQHKQLGVIAQELETVFPSMVEESQDYEEVTTTDEDGNDQTKRVLTGTTTKSVKYSVFIPMLIKAMQEQQAIIESLKARLDAANL
jgi:hypothetical protein